LKADFAMDVESAILERLDRHGFIEDTSELAAALGKEHNEVVGSMKSLQAHEMVLVEVSLQFWSINMIQGYRMWITSGTV